MSRLIGSNAEELALSALLKRGDTLIQQNYHCKEGEIDLITQANTTLIFTEVKARKSYRYGHPSEFVDKHKQIKIIKTAKRFLHQHPIWHTYPMRFDVVCVNLNNQHIEIIENAFYI